MKHLLAFLCLLSASLLPALARGEPEEDRGAQIRALPWQQGPTTGAVAGKASIKVPQGHVYLDAKNTHRFLELTGNPPDDLHTLVAPASLKWLAFFAFNDSGYVKDDETIDADQLLDQLKAGDERGNARRRELGMQPLFTDGWQVPPHYDSSSRRLEWGVRLRTGEGHTLVNYTVRLLGRTGVMSAVLVSAPDRLDADRTAFKSLLEDFTYNDGEGYAEYRPGDKVAEYGLAALVLGGAAALATKKGLWAALGGLIAAFWKLGLGLAVAGFAAVRAWFSRKR